MGGNVLRWLISLGGYLLYTLAVLVFLLWFLFPTDTVKDWFEQQLNTRYPNYDWIIDSLSIGFPARLVMTKVEVTPAHAKSAPLTIDELSFSPAVPLLLQKKKAFNYSLELLDGFLL